MPTTHALLIDDATPSAIRDIARWRRLLRERGVSPGNVAALPSATADGVLEALGAVIGKLKADADTHAIVAYSGLGDWDPARGLLLGMGDGELPVSEIRRVVVAAGIHADRILFVFDTSHGGAADDTRTRRAGNDVPAEPERAPRLGRFAGVIAACARPNAAHTVDAEGGTVGALTHVVTSFLADEARALHDFDHWWPALKAAADAQLAERGLGQRIVVEDPWEFSGGNNSLHAEDGSLIGYLFVPTVPVMGTFFPGNEYYWFNTAIPTVVTIQPITQIPTQALQQPGWEEHPQVAFKLDTTVPFAQVTLGPDDRFVEVRAFRQGQLRRAGWLHRKVSGTSVVHDWVGDSDGLTPIPGTPTRGYIQIVGGTTGRIADVQQPAMGAPVRPSVPFA